MQTYLISYDLRKPGRDYTNLFAAIKSLANGWWHGLDSTWLINSPRPASDIRDFLRAHIDTNDALFVIVVGDDWASYGLTDDANNWLRNDLKPLAA